MQDMGHGMSHGLHGGSAHEMTDMPGMAHPGTHGEHANHTSMLPDQAIPHVSHGVLADRAAPRHPASERHNPLVDMRVDARSRG